MESGQKHATCCCLLHVTAGQWCQHRTQTRHWRCFVFHILLLLLNCRHSLKSTLKSSTYLSVNSRQFNPPNSTVFSLTETYHHSDTAQTNQISPLLWLQRRTVASCMVYLFKSIPIKEPFGLNTLDKDQGGRGSSPVELFTRGQRTSALSSLGRSPTPSQP